MTIGDHVAGDQITVGAIEGEGIAIGRDARVEINRYTEIIIRPDSFEDVPPAPGEPPYKGLSYFTEADADNFFGREALSAAISRRIEAHSFLAVIGASGSGKSSLLRAGVVPLLREKNWLIRIMSPTARPLQRLANALTAEDSSLTAVDGLEADIASNPRILHLAANRLTAQANADRMLLVIDQFEELFTLCEDESERTAFIQNILTAVAEQGALSILIGLRADFYSHTSQYEGLRTRVSQQQEFIGPLRQQDLVRAIAEPARRGGWQFVEGLVEQILEDTAGEPGYLPLLSHALRETWELRRGTVMTLGGYRAAGGVAGAIATTAEDTLQSLDQAQIPAVRHIFLTLTELGEGAEDTRRIATQEELKGIDAGTADIDEIIERLIQARLIIVDGTRVEVAHEAIIRRWPRLRSWIEEDHERLSFNRRLTRAVEEWERNECQMDYLFRGAQLEQAESRISEYSTWSLTAKQEAFISASRETAALAALQEQRHQEAGRQHARRSTNLAVAGGIVGLGLSAILVNLAVQELSGILAVFYVAGGFFTGAFVGFFYVPFFDSIVATVRQKSPLLTWPAAILSGIVAFVLAALLFFFLLSEDLPIVLLLGCAWGSAAGIGRLWLRKGDRSPKITIPVAAAASGTMLALVYGAALQFGWINQPFPLWLVCIIGMLVPLAILVAEGLAHLARFRRVI